MGGSDAPKPKVQKPPPDPAPPIQQETEASKAAGRKQQRKPRGVIENVVRGNPANSSKETLG